MEKLVPEVNTAATMIAVVVIVVVMFICDYTEYLARVV